MALAEADSPVADVLSEYDGLHAFAVGSSGPLVGGTAMQHTALAAPLLIGGTLKIFHDLALYRSFRHLRPPQEQAGLTTGLQRRV